MLLIILLITVGIISLWKGFLNLTAKEIFWEDGSSFYYRKWKYFDPDMCYLGIYIKKKAFGITYLKKVKENSTFYWPHEIDTLRKVKFELKELIKKYLDEKGVNEKLKDWDGELFEPTLQIKRDKKIEKILNRN